jgi:hypothetical protein
LTEVLLRDELVLDQRFHPVQCQLGVPDVGLLAEHFGLRGREIGLGAVHRVDIVGMVDFHEQLAGFDAVAPVHVHLADIAVHA